MGKVVAFDLEAFLQERIPLTRALGCQVIAADRGGVHLRAPLEPNINMHGTAFAGSLASLSLLSGWIWVVVALRDCGEQAAVVVRRCEVDYLAPVDGELEVHCEPPVPAEWQIFSNSFRERGRARLSLASTVSTIDGIPKVRTLCEYAVKRVEKPAPTNYPACPGGARDG
jgi:thioesterase domain-containing protein